MQGITRKGPDGYFPEIYNILIAVILQPEISGIGPEAAVRFKVKFPLRHGLALAVVGYFLSIYIYDGPLAVYRDFHRVPFRSRFARFGQRLCEGIQGSGYMIFIFIGKFRFIIYLYLITIKYRHPLFPRLNRNPDKDPGIIIFIFHLIYYPEYAMAEFLALSL